jgi:hypothetical protein
MTDRELLELAAKAAGFAEARWQDISGWGEVRHGLSTAIWTGEDYWNPLESDGDALRLAVKLEIHAGYAELSGCGFASWHRGNSSVSEYGPDDPYAATRRAIVRAAAAIGAKDAKQGEAK